MDFDKAAATWDSPVRIERAKVLAAEILKSWPESPASALDFGCGSGLIAFRLCGRAGEVFGYDPSPDMARAFREKAKAHPACGARFISREEMSRRTFDVIVSSMVLHHIRDVRGEIAALRERLAPDGRFFWIDLDAEDGAFHRDEPGFDGHDGFERDAVLKILKECGFRSASIRTVFEGHKATGGGPLAYSLFLAIGDNG
jgi:SAM-dependent methyltransferase